MYYLIYSIMEIENDDISSDDSDHLIIDVEKIDDDENNHQSSSAASTFGLCARVCVCVCNPKNS